MPAAPRVRVDLVEDPIAALAEYARVSIAFDIDTVFDVIESDGGPDQWTLAERQLDAPYEKDYDRYPGEHPLEWPQRFDLSRWGMVAAYIDNRHVGGAMVAFGPGTEALTDRADTAVLYDIRVQPDARGGGVGSALFEAAERWAVSRGARTLQIETQNTNVRSCRFYQRRGCTLGEVHRFAYPQLPDEIHLLWLKDLSSIAR
jgi:GNAT superfamily N-acetyltransferase